MGKAKGPRKSRQHKKPAGLEPVIKTGAPVDTEKSVRAVKRNARGSRNKKQNTRKIDIADVEQHMEDVLHDERTGGSATTKKDEQLFYIAKKGEASQATSMQSRKERARAKVLHSDKVLEPNPHIKVYKQKMTKKSAHGGDGKGDPQAEYVVPIPFVPTRTITRKRRKTDLPERDLPLINTSQECSTELPMAVTGKIEGPAELWERPEKEKTDVDLNPWLQIEKERAMEIKQKSATFAKPEESSTPVVEIAEMGLSYNPTFKSHQSVLAKALVKEMTNIQETERLRSVQPKKRSGRQKSDQLFKEMSVGFADDVNTDDETSDEEEGLEEEEKKFVAKKLVAAENRKTRAQKNKALKHQEKIAKLQAAKLAKTQENEVFRLRHIKKELNEFEQKKADRLVARKQKQIEALKMPKILSSDAFKEPRDIYKLTEELTGSLRTSKGEGHPLRERLKSMQKRNVIEVRTKKHLSRRYRLKEYQKRSYKNYDLSLEITQQREDKISAKKAKKGASLPAI